MKRLRTLFPVAVIAASVCIEPLTLAAETDHANRVFQSGSKTRSIRLIENGQEVWQLPKFEFQKPFRPTYVWKGRTNGMETFNQNSHSIGLLILKNGQIVDEQYLAGATRETWFASFSVGKSFTSTLVGLAIQDGFIASVDDLLIKYVSGLIGSAYQDVSIKDALQMMTGIAFEKPDYNFADTTDPFSRAIKESMVEHRYRFVEAAMALPKECPPGTRFIYNTMDSAILGWLVENATRSRIAHYMEERLWKPAGMESKAAWMIDEPPAIGREMAGGDILATLRDYGRFGLLWLNKGKANDRQILSPEWIAAATRPDREGVQYGNLDEGYPLGYGYQWWLLKNGHFAASGLYGQMIYVAPEAGVVIVKLSQWPQGWDTDLEMESYAFFEAVIAALE